MRCYGVGNPESPSCPGSRLSCVRLLLLPSIDYFPLALSTSYLQNHCLWRCCLSDWMIPGEPFIDTQTHTELDNRMPVIIFNSTACVVAWQLSHVECEVWPLIFADSVTINIFSYTVYKEQFMLQLKWKSSLFPIHCHHCQNKQHHDPCTLDDCVYLMKRMPLHINT